MVWIDKDNIIKNRTKYDENRSIFNYGDFRHNLPTKELARKYDSLVSQKPRQFFNWNDGTKFDPKYKRDK